jgi:sulfur-oxidizing protein SoxX
VVPPEAVKIVDSEITESLTGTPGDPVNGKAVFTGRKAGNCLACHALEALAQTHQFHGEVGPPLDGVGDTYTEAELRARVVNPKVDLPDTIMPSFYHVGGNRVAKKFQGKTILSAQEVEDVVAYLLTLKD